MMKNICYISGPMTGIPEHNRPLFFAAEEHLKMVWECVVLNPARNPEGLDYDAYMRIDLAMLAEADVLVLLPGWEDSKGARIELDAFLNNGGDSISFLTIARPDDEKDWPRLIPMSTDAIKSWRAAAAKTSKSTPNPSSALSTQVGGDHYNSCAIQPVQFIEANKLEFLEGCVVKRVTRHNKPTGKGRQDIEKAIHELQLLLELRYGK